MSVMVVRRRVCVTLAVVQASWPLLYGILDHRVFCEHNYVPAG